MAGYVPGGAPRETLAPAGAHGKCPMPVVPDPKPANSSERPQPLGSTIGRKVVMALSGAVLVGFALAHMAGHLKVYAGRDDYNAYAAFLQGLGGLKWLVRFGLLAALVVHVRSGLTLAARNKGARPHAYAVKRAQRSTPYGRTMLLSGLVFVAFLIYHLAHFTLGWVHPQYFALKDALGRTDVYGNFVRSFQSPIITGTYVIATAAVSMHVAHAASSVLRTLGISSGALRRSCERVGPALGVLLFVGFASVPVACLLDLVKP